MLARACITAIASVLECCAGHRPSIERCTIGCEGWALAAVHDGIFKSNFTVSKRKENSSVAFGKVAEGNELSGNAFFGNDAERTLQRGRRFNRLKLVHKTKKVKKQKAKGICNLTGAPD